MEQTTTTTTMSKMVDLNSSISVIILHVNGLNTPVKKQRLSQCVKKQDKICYLQETQFKYKNT